MASRQSIYQHDNSDGMPKGVNVKPIVEALRRNCVYRLLDIGGGKGEFVKHCKRERACLRCSLVDIAKPAVEIAKHNGLDAYVCDVGNERLPFSSNEFGAVHMGDTLEHIFSTDSVLSEVKRVLTPNGLFIVTIPNMASWFNRIMLLFGVQPYSTHVCDETPGPRTGGHIRVMTTRMLVWLLRKHDFDVECLLGAGFDHWYGVSVRHPVVTRIFDKLFAWNPYWSNRVTVIARKRWNVDKTG